MTLFNQINSLLLGLFLLVVTSLAYFQFTQTKTFMANQIASDLNNTTNALTLMLKPHLETGDIASAETVINVIFEGGFYKKVSLTWLENNKTQVWENPIKVAGVPQWFLDINLFEAQSTESTITNGWIQLATLDLQANPAIGYSQLWKVMTETFIALTALFFVSLLILHLRLKRILAPLHRVASQAKLIAKREFQPNLAIPKTTELKEVVLAINSMSGQLQAVFSQLDKEVVSLKKDKLTETVSQLPNRLYLNGQLESWIKDPGYGGLLIARLDWLETIYDQLGYQVRDNTIKILAKEMQQTLPSVSPCFIARISNREFVFLVTKATQDQLKIYLQKVSYLINEAMRNTNYDGEEQFAIGGAIRTENITASGLLANADHALQHALNESKVSHWYEDVVQEDITLTQWQTYLEEAIAKKYFQFKWHPAMSFKNDNILHHEIYSILEIDNKQVRAAKFMPYIEQLELGSQFDKSLIETLVESPMLKGNQKTIAINITQDSILDSGFHSWLGVFLIGQANQSRFYFEVQENTILNYPEQSQQFVNLVKKMGAKVSIDHYGREMGSLAYLQTIKPDYVKLDQSLSCNISNEMEVGELAQRLILTRAVINTALGLGVEVIITGVEDYQQLERVNGLYATGYQGFIIPPSDLY